MSLSSKTTPHSSARPARYTKASSLWIARRNSDPAGPSWLPAMARNWSPRIPATEVTRSRRARSLVRIVSPAAEVRSQDRTERRCAAQVEQQKLVSPTQFGVHRLPGTGVVDGQQIEKWSTA